MGGGTLKLGGKQYWVKVMNMHDNRNKGQERELYHRAKEDINPAVPAEQRQADVQIHKTQEVIAESERTSDRARHSIYEIFGNPFNGNR